MEKTLSLTWDNPIPHPDCGYKAFYRRKGDSEYTEIDTSGSTSGTTNIVAQLSAPANIEGYITSDCCSGSESVGAPFGINSYSPFNVDVVNNTIDQQYIATVSSEYPNTYRTLIQGTFQSTIDGTVPFGVIYPSGSTSTDFIIDTASPAAVVSNIVVTSYSSIFDYGGQLQQFDPFTTPPYFEFYWDGTTGVTWNGSPSSLPSFTLDAFNITEQDEDENALQGNLLISWVYDSLYGDGESPYNLITLEVFDPGNNSLGEVVLNASPLGVRNSAIVLTRFSEAFPLTDQTQLTMQARWNDESVIDSHSFYLPI